MNKARRKDIEALVASLENIKETLTNAAQLAEPIRDEEQESFDNLSEGLQQSEKGTTIEEAASALDSAVSALESAIDSLDEAITLLALAKGE